MKLTKVVIICIAVLVVGMGVFSGYRIEKQKLDRIVGARDSMYTKQIQDLQSQNDQLTKAVLLEKDHYLIQNGKVLYINSIAVPTTQEITLHNQAVLSTDGVLTQKDGTKQMLTTGQSVWADGTVMNVDGSITPAK